MSHLRKQDGDQIDVTISNKVEVVKFFDRDCVLLDSGLADALRGTTRT